MAGGEARHMAGEQRGADVATRVRLCVAGSLLALCLVARLAFERFGAALFPAYRQLSKAVMVALAAVMSVVPFAVWDVLVVVLAVVAVVALVRRIRGHKGLLAWFSWVALVASCALALFVGWALNHYAPPLADDLGLEVGQYTVEQLADATEHYLREAAGLAAEVPRDDDGTLLGQEFFELAGIAGASYEPLAGEWPVFQGSTAPVKALLLWGEPQLYSGHTGIFWAPTGESTVPLHCATADMPFTMCHEAAHRLGVASEQEANFCAFLACVTSDDVRFAYSGSYSAFCYCLNALYRADPDRAQQVVQSVADSGLYEGVALVLADRAATREHYQAYEGPFEEVGTTVNNTYLRSFGESAGVRSYGLVVDYLIAWYETAGRV